MGKVRNLEQELRQEKVNNEILTKEKEDTVASNSDKQEPIDNSTEKKAERRQRQKMKKVQTKKIFPTQGQTINVKKFDFPAWRKAKVTGVFKKTSIHKNFKQLTFDNGFKTDVDFENEVEDWKPFKEEEETY